MATAFHALIAAIYYLIYIYIKLLKYTLCGTALSNSVWKFPLIQKHGSKITYAGSSMGHLPFLKAILLTADSLLDPSQITGLSNSKHYHKMQNGKKNPHQETMYRGGGTYFCRPGRTSRFAEKYNKIIKKLRRG